MAPSSGELWGHHLMPQVCNSHWHDVPEQQCPSTDGPGGLPASQWCHCASSMSKVRTLLLMAGYQWAQTGGLCFVKVLHWYKGILLHTRNIVRVVHVGQQQKSSQLSCICVKMNHWGYWTGIGINGLHPCSSWCTCVNQGVPTGDPEISPVERSPKLPPVPPPAGRDQQGYHPGLN